MQKLIALFAFSVLVGCAPKIENDPSAPLSYVRVHKMGPDQFMITCVDNPKYCAEWATKSCPAAFDVVSNTTNAEDYGRMTMIIRCKD